MNEDDLHVVELAFDEELTDEDLAEVIGGVLQDGDAEIPPELRKLKNDP